MGNSLLSPVDDYTFRKDMQEKGHMCLNYRGMPPKLVWCKQEPCLQVLYAAKQAKEKMENFVNEREADLFTHVSNAEFVEYLRAKGHTCAGIVETLPPQRVWCKSDPCKQVIYSQEQAAQQAEVNKTKASSYTEKIKVKHLAQ